jgi:hypothetical protein
LASIIRRAKDLNHKIGELNDTLKSKRATGASGGGMVKVEVNGLGTVLRVQIEPSLFEQGDREMIEVLIPAAMNQAAAKAKELHVEAMKSMTAGLEFPGLSEALAQYIGTDDDLKVDFEDDSEDEP